MVDKTVGIGVNVLADTDIILVATAVINLNECLVGSTYVVEGLLVVEPGIGVDMFTDANVNGLVVVITPLEFASSVP